MLLTSPGHQKSCKSERNLTIVEQSIFAGPAVRRLRRREGLTQAALAARLRISAPYLNLIERNQRPLTARVVMALIGEFAFDPREMQVAQDIGGTEGLHRRLTDERFADLAIDREEADDLLSASPQVATAFARLYDAGTTGGGHEADSIAIARREVEKWRNHFADLDHAAETMADEMRLSRGDSAIALAERLRTKHHLSVRLLPADVLTGVRSRIDLHARQVQLLEMLSPASRQFELAFQLADLEQNEAITTLVAGARLKDPNAATLFARHLKAYFAAALLMPYGRFHRACEATGYDVATLQARFGVGFEQLVHRLTTLSRVGQQGLPFFMARIDRAGQYSKRFIGASGAHFLEADHICPLWCGPRSFERRGEMLTQNFALAEQGGAQSHWFAVARTVGDEQARFAVVLGLEAAFASDFAMTRGVDLERASATLIGPGCRRCHASACPQRSMPAAGVRLADQRLLRPSMPFAS